LLLTRIGVSTPYGYILPIFMLMGFGMGSTMTPMTAAVMNAVGPERAGLGSATTNTSRELGGVFGIALLGTLLTTKLKSVLTASIGSLGLTSAQRGLVLNTAGHGTLDSSVLAKLPPAQAGGLVHQFGNAFIAGFHLALLVAAFFLFAASVASFLYIPKGAPQREVATSPHVEAEAAATV
jgi:hypothetical protein